MVEKDLKLEDKAKLCRGIHKTSQRGLLGCYDYIGKEYGQADKLKICTDEHKTWEEINDLYTCMEEFGVKKTTEYCMLNGEYVTLNTWIEPNSRLYYSEYTGTNDGFFSC